MRPQSHDLLFDLAQRHDGYFTTAEAKAEGLSITALLGYLERGSLERPSRGVYRLTRYPEMTPNSYLWANVLWPQAHSPVRAVLSHHTALRLHGLSDTNPTVIHLTIPKTFRIRRDHPKQLRLHRADLPDYDVEYVDGLPVTTVDRSLRDVAQIGDDRTLSDALRDARRRDLPIPRELQRV